MFDTEAHRPVPVTPVLLLQVHQSPLLSSFDADEASASCFWHASLFWPMLAARQQLHDRHRLRLNGNRVGLS